MKTTPITVSILGCGCRGGDVYGRYMQKFPEKFQIVSLCDVRKDRLAKYGETLGIPEENRFLDVDTFFSQRRSDLLIIATQDDSHVAMALKALPLKYDILMEKPISKYPEELARLNKAREASGSKIFVCHVLRYTIMIEKLKEMIDAGAIGRLIAIDHTENVTFWHAAHSFCRGNWRDSNTTSPMIMAKCCHDMDLIQYFAGSRCKTVSSMGDLNFFKRENQPEGAADRCCSCALKDTCSYSAYRIYLEGWKKKGCPENAWPMNIITEVLPLSEEALTEAIETGPYGRCVFACDNNVVDHQNTIMTFENGVSATLKMNIYVNEEGRDIRFCGTEGELVLLQNQGIIRYYPFHGEKQIISLRDLSQNTMGHGGGDERMIDRLYEVLTEDDASMQTSLGASLESHYMCLAAEKSRLAGGSCVQMTEYRD